MTPKNIQWDGHKVFFGQKYAKVAILWGKKKSLKLTCWLLKFGSFLLSMIKSPPTSQNWKEKKEKKNPCFNHLNNATQYAVVEPFYKSKQTEKQGAHRKMTSVVSCLLLFFHNQPSRLFYILYFWITGYQYNWLKNWPTNYQIIQLFLGNNCWLCIRVSSQIPLRTIGYIA